MQEAPRGALEGAGSPTTAQRCSRRTHASPRRAPGAARRRSIHGNSMSRSVRPASVRGFGRHDAGSGIMPGVRGTGRGRCPRPMGEDPVQWGKTPSRGANPRPEDHDGHVHNEASPAQGCRARRWRAPPHGRHGWDRQARAGPAAPTSSRRFRRHRDENPAPGQHDMSGVPTARSVSQDAGFPRHCNENPVSDHHRMSGDEPRTNRLQHRGNTAIPGKPDLKPTQSVQ